MAFFEAKQPPAILKHSVLRRYMRVFVPKVASQARGRRVVYVDAFAGAGRYRDGDPASPAIVWALSQEVATWEKAIDLDCIFIEKNLEHYSALSGVVPPDRAWHGQAEDHLGDVLSRAEGQPLFMLVDPWGQPIPATDLTNRVLARPRGQGLATEVLINFSVATLQRMGGRLEQGQQRSHADSVLRRYDRAMGGHWWHARGRRLAQGVGSSQTERGTLERSLVEEYARRLAEATGYVSVIAPIWRHGWKHKRPFFFLIFLTANPQGVWFYADALVDAMDEYYAVTHEEQHDLFDSPEARRHSATEVIAGNISRMADEGTFIILDRTLEVLSGVLGDGGRGEVAAAVRREAKRGHITVYGSITKSKIYEATISPGGSPGLF